MKTEDEKKPYTEVDRSGSKQPSFSSLNRIKILKTNLRDERLKVEMMKPKKYVKLRTAEKPAEQHHTFPELKQQILSRISELESKVANITVQQEKQIISDGLGEYQPSLKSYGDSNEELKLTGRFKDMRE